MGRRLALIVGLSLWFPLLRGEFFTPYFSWPVEGPVPAIVFNICTVLVTVGIASIRGLVEWLFNKRPETVTVCCLLSAGLLLPFAVTSPAPGFVLLAIVAVAMSFCLLSASWGMLCHSLHQNDLHGAFLDVAIAYALSYFTMLPGLSGTLPGAMRAICIAGSGIAFYFSIAAGSPLTIPRRSFSGVRNLLPQGMGIAIGMYFIVELLSAVLVGIFIPASHPEFASPWRSRISFASALVLVAFWLPRKRPLPSAFSIFFGMVIILVGSLLLMSNIDPLVDLGTHVLTTGRRFYWTLLWMQLLGICFTAPLCPAITLGSLFPLAFMAARIPVNILRVIDPAQSMTPEGVYMTSLVLSLLLIASALALAWLEALRSRGTANRTASPAHLDSESIRAQVAAELSSSHNLTEREASVLELLSHGYTVKRIAEELYVSDNTVRAHTKAIYRKIGCHSKQELVDLVERLMEETALHTQAHIKNEGSAS